MLKFLVAVGLGLGALAATDACAEELPVRKAGRWQLTSVSESIGMKTFETCITAADSVVGGKQCNVASIKRLADETYVDVVCTSDGGTEKISTVYTGDFTTWYRAMSKITFDPPQDGVPHMGVTVDGKYLGSECRSASATVGP